MHKVQVSERAVVARLSRHLRKDNMFLKKCRTDSRWHLELGDYFIVDENRGIMEKNVDPEGMAREEGVMKPFEEMSEG